MFSSLTSWADQVADQVKKVADVTTSAATTATSNIESFLDSQAPSMYSNTANKCGESAAHTTAELPWDDVPASWTTQGKETDWAQIVVLITDDSNTFLVDYTRAVRPSAGDVVASSPQLQGKEQQQSPVDDFTFEFTPDTVTLCTTAATSCEVLAKQRFNLVPKWTTEKCFWANYFWRLQELGKTDGSVAAVEAVLTCINTEPELTEGRKKHFGVPEDDQHIALVKDIVRRYALWIDAREKGDALIKQVGEDVRSARDNARLLATLNDRTDVELRESIFQSFRYQKTKVGGRISELDNLVQVMRSSMYPKMGAKTSAEHPSSVAQYFSTLEEALADLHSVNQELMAHIKGESMKVVSANTNDVDDSPAVKAAPECAAADAEHGSGTTQSEGDPHAEAATSDSGAHAAAGAISVDDEYFKAKLPWDEDDDTNNAAAGHHHDEDEEEEEK
eukprot:PhM_4_TR7328/c0_g1_i1/m.31610